ncbi:uncharacterized protein LOC103787903 isoform X3 [Callithrix jacchus]
MGFLERWGTLAPQNHLAQQGSLGPSPNSSPWGALYSLQPPTDKDNGDSGLASAIVDTVLVGIPGPRGPPGPPDPEQVLEWEAGGAPLWPQMTSCDSAHRSSRATRSPRTTWIPARPDRGETQPSLTNMEKPRLY